MKVGSEPRKWQYQCEWESCTSKDVHDTTCD